MMKPATARFLSTGVAWAARSTGGSGQVAPVASAPAAAATPASAPVNRLAQVVMSDEEARRQRSCSSPPEGKLLS